MIYWKSSKNGALFLHVPFFPIVQAVPGIFFLVYHRRKEFHFWKAENVFLNHCTIRAMTFLAPHGKGGKTYIGSFISCYMTSSSGRLNSLIFSIAKAIFGVDQRVRPRSHSDILVCAPHGLYQSRERHPDKFDNPQSSTSNKTFLVIG